MSWDAFVYRSPILAMVLIGLMLLGSHLWEAATVIDQRRKARKH